MGLDIVSVDLFKHGHDDCLHGNGCLECVDPLKVDAVADGAGYKSYLFQLFIHISPDLIFDIGLDAVWYK